MPSMTDPEMSGTVLDPAAKTPLHAQLAGLLRERISDGRLQPGDTLPSDAQLQEIFGVSRSVARQAMTTLVAEGVVQRARGRGSVVAPRREHHRLAHRAAGLSSQAAQTGSVVTTRVLDLRRETPPAHAAALLGVPGDTQVLRLERLRAIDGTPAAFIRTWLPDRFAEGLTADGLRNASLHEQLAARHRVRLTGGSRQVRAVAADEHLAALLDTRTGAPLLLLEGTTTTSSGEAIEAFSTWHRGDLITFDLAVDERGRAEAAGSEPAGSAPTAGPAGSEPAAHPAGSEPAGGEVAAHPAGSEPAAEPAGRMAAGEKTSAGRETRSGATAAERGADVSSGRRPAAAGDQRNPDTARLAEIERLARTLLAEVERAQRR